jgi:hypothetical protein
MSWLFINSDRTPNSINLICLGIYQHWYASKFYQLDMCWIFIKLIQLQYFYQLDMCWIFITVDTTPNSINLICLGYLSTLIELQILSTWYMFDIYQLDMSWYYQHWYASNFYQLDMSWYLSTLICFQFLSTWYVLDIYQVDTTPIFLSTWYVLDIYHCWYDSKFYQLDMCWIFINSDRTPNSINLIYVWYLSTWYVLVFITVDMLISINLICLGIYQHWYASNFYQLDMSWYLSTLICFQFLSTWYVLDIYQHDMCWIFINLIQLQYFYQLDMCWIFITVDTTPNSINLICLGYLSTLIELQILSTWYVLAIYQQW